MHYRLESNYGLYFLGWQIFGSTLPLQLETLAFLTSFFLLVNLVGAIFGYWISKTTFIDKLLKKDRMFSLRFKLLTHQSYNHLGEENGS